MQRRHIYPLLLIIFSSFLFISCASEVDTNDPGNVNIQQVACSSHQATFDTNVWPVLDNNCFSCHKLNGVSSDLVLLPESFNNYAQANFSTFQKIAAKKDSKGISLLISKPTDANNNHGGGKRFEATSTEQAAITDMVEKLSSCRSDALRVVDLNLGTDYQRLRKTTLAIAGRLPKLGEEQQLNAVSSDITQKEITFDSILDTLLTSNYFLDRLKIMFNDLYLLDAFTGTSALNFDLRNFANENFFDTDQLSPFYSSSSDRNTIRKQASRGLAQAPFELIANVVKKNRPFTEILTADYVMVNPYSATIYGADTGDASFNFAYGDGVTQHDASDFREAKLVDENSRTIPTAGILTSHSFLRRYPSTSTNRNRARSRVVYSYFLNINVLGLASRANLDLNNVVGEFPTLQDPQCRVCHDTVDPIAGLYKNWRNNGSYRGDQKWFNERTVPQMLAPGFTQNAADQLPNAESAKAVQWLASKIVVDPGFSSRVVETLFKGLTGQQLPVDFNFVNVLKDNFVASNYSIKSLTKQIVNSPYFIATNLHDKANPNLYPDVGMGRLLTPELLDKKIQAVTGGYRWKSPSGKTLADVATYKLLYGGIDSSSVVTRTTDPTSLMTGVQQQIANETACNVVPLDFNTSQQNRALFPIANITDIPDGAIGTQHIKENIIHLQKQLWGEQYAIDSKDVTRTYDLFVAVRDLTMGQDLPIDCRVGLASSNLVRKDTDRTVRPWMAVVTYLMSDYQFFYE